MSHSAPPPEIVIREGSRADIADVARVDAACFEGFWEWQEPELLGFLSSERLAVATTHEGAIVGYTLATTNRGTATLTRLAVVPEARNRGVGSALVGEVAAWARARGAATFALCTQVDNSVSRRLYAGIGLTELEERYAFAMGDISRGAER
jgi:ribosomal protein S18 acetylase RimI-like enzyme